MDSSARVHIVGGDPVGLGQLAAVLARLGIGVDRHSGPERLMAALDGNRPSCIVTDLRLNGMSGLELVRAMKDRGFHFPIIVMSEQDDARLAVQCIKAGASDFLLKPVNEHEFIASVVGALADARSRAEDVAEMADLRGRLQQLSSRESEILAMVIVGELNKEIASRLGISDRTVEIHKAKILRKMAAINLCDLIRIAIRLELIPIRKALNPGTGRTAPEYDFTEA